MSTSLRPTMTPVPKYVNGAFGKFTVNLTMADQGQSDEVMGCPAAAG